MLPAGCSSHWPLGACLFPDLSFHSHDRISPESGVNSSPSLTCLIILLPVDGLGVSLHLRFSLFKGPHCEFITPHVTWASQYEFVNSLQAPLYVQVKCLFALPGGNWPVLITFLRPLTSLQIFKSDLFLKQSTFNWALQSWNLGYINTCSWSNILTFHIFYCKNCSFNKHSYLRIWF